MASAAFAAGNTVRDYRALSVSYPVDRNNPMELLIGRFRI
jgi:hypothetical protein